MQDWSKESMATASAQHAKQQHFALNPADLGSCALRLLHVPSTVVLHAK